MLKYVWHIRRRLCLNKTTLKLRLSLYTLQVFRHHYRIHLNTLGVFSDYDKAVLAYFRNTHQELRIPWNTFVLLIMPGDFKGTVYTKNRMGHYILA
jgi:hypothetical protein